MCSVRQVILLQAAAERLSPLSGNISKIKGNINGTARLKRLLLVYPRPKRRGFTPLSDKLEKQFPIILGHVMNLDVFPAPYIYNKIIHSMGNCSYAMFDEL